MNLNNSNFAFNNTQQDLREPIQLNFYSLVTISLPLVAIIGNWAVILSVKREKSLQTSTNFLIVSLAVADLLVGLIVMPWGIFALVSILNKVKNTKDFQYGFIIYSFCRLKSTHKAEGWFMILVTLSQHWTMLTFETIFGSIAWT